MADVTVNPNGVEASKGLWDLAWNLDQVASPKHGRYASIPAVTNEHGVVSLPHLCRTGKRKPLGSRLPVSVTGYAVMKLAGRKKSG
jgi:hypothetical protein